MKIHFETHIPLSWKEVQGRFNRSLLDYLRPPFPLVEIEQYDGNHPGARVSLRLNFILFKISWVSLITEEFQDSERYFFIDEGIRLPPFLKSWKHRHQIEQTGPQSCKITDDISFEPGPFWPGFLVKFMLWAQFSQRPRLYKKFFRKG